MNIYFCCSITGGRKYLSTNKKIVTFLKNLDYNVLTEHIVTTDIFNIEKQYTAEYIFERDIKWIDECHAVIAEVSNPSLGVGYEICHALNKGKPVLCLYDKDIFLSRMISGNTKPGIIVKAYSDSEWQEHIENFLKKINT
ncbi:nucleoside 2-deoxyribosyltransferase [candidate division KSB1 bacterium]|nr:nucleoside 2-deoxyribosyltransferase [candidate division KSB1 bacterium]